MSPDFISALRVYRSKFFRAGTLLSHFDKKKPLKVKPQELIKPVSHCVMSCLCVKMDIFPDVIRGDCLAVNGSWCGVS